MQSTRAKDVLAGVGAVAACAIAVRAAAVAWQRLDLALGPVQVRKYKGRWALVTGGEVPRPACISSEQLLLLDGLNDLWVCIEGCFCKEVCICLNIPLRSWLCKSGTHPLQSPPPLYTPTPVVVKRGVSTLPMELHTPTCSVLPMVSNQLMRSPCRRKL